MPSISTAEKITYLHPGAGHITTRHPAAGCLTTRHFATVNTGTITPCRRMKYQ